MNNKRFNLIQVLIQIFVVLQFSKYCFFYIDLMNSKFDKLIKCVKKGEIEKSSQILQQATLNINQLDPKTGKSLLQLAMQNQSDQIFNMLASYPGIDVEQISKEGQLTLQTAVLLNNIYFVSKLLETGNVNPKKRNSSQQTVLEVAVKNQTSRDIIKKLVQYKFDLNQQVSTHGSLINLAIVSNQIQNLIFLIQFGLERKDYAKLSVLDQNDNTCLILAVQSSKGDAVSAILDYLSHEGCPLSELQKQFFINSQNKSGNTAHHVACQKNLQTIVSLLETRGKQYGIDLELRNKQGLKGEEIKNQTERQRVLEIQLKQKNQQQKRIYLKQKQIQRQRVREQEQRAKQEQKRKRKQEQLLLMKQQQYQKELTHNKTKWVCGIAIILIVGLMYLAILNAVEQKKVSQL